MAGVNVEQRLDHFEQPFDGGERGLSFAHREEAELVATAALGALGAALFSHDQPEALPPMLRPKTEPSTETVLVEYEAFTPELDVPRIPQERLKGRAALYFAAEQISLN